MSATLPRRWWRKATRFTWNTRPPPWRSNGGGPTSTTGETAASSVTRSRPSRVGPAPRRMDLRRPRERPEASPRTHRKRAPGRDSLPQPLLAGTGPHRRPQFRAQDVHGARLLVRCPRNDLFKFNQRLCEKPTCLTCLTISGKPPQLWRYLPSGLKPFDALDVAIAPSDFLRGMIAPYLRAPVVHIPNFAPDPNPSG